MGVVGVLINFVTTALTANLHTELSLTPEPLSPLFKPGSPISFLVGLNEDLTFTLGFTALLALIDVALVRPLLHPKSRYFALHFVTNMIAAYACLPDVVRGLTGDPQEAFRGPAYSMVPPTVVAAIHIYHCLAFKLTPDDIFHHAVFVVTLCLFAVLTKHIGGTGCNFGTFFLSGLPGGIDYLLLVLNYEGYVTRATEKRWFTRINVWLRGPGLVIAAFVGCQTWMNHFDDMWILATFFTIFLLFYNGQYYLQQAVTSNSIFFYKEKLERAKDQDGEGKRQE